MPTYYSPPPTPPASPPPSTFNSKSRTHSYSHSPSGSHSDTTEDTKADSLIKTSVVFLGAVVAATFCAHRFWPKGITYGDKEAWEIEKKVEKVKKGLRDEKQRGRRDDGRGSPGGSSGQSGREERRARYREGGRSGGYAARDEDDSPRDRSRNRSRRPSRERSRDSGYDRYDRDRGSSRDRHSDRGLSQDRGEYGFAERRSSRREPKYYPPQPQRYAIDRSGSTSGSRRSSLDRGHSRRYYDEDPEPEPQYVYRDVPRQSRRYSVDGGSASRRRYGDERDYY